MKILVTGSEGFIGQHLVRRLLAAGHDILGVDSMEPRIHQNRTPKDQGYEVITTSYDALPYHKLRDIEVIVHLAAQVGVANSMVEPARYLQHNSYATANFLSDVDYACKDLQKILVASSMSVYGDPQTENNITEDHPIRPESPYGLSKYDQEQLVRMYSVTHPEVKTIGMRFFNVYGPGQAMHNPYTGVIANFANQLLRDEPPTIYEDGMQTRDFIYVEDLAERIKHCIDHDWDQSWVVNFCSGEATTVLEMAETLADVLGKSHIRPNITGELRPGDIRDCVGNGTRLWSLLWEKGPYIWRSVQEGLEDYATELLEEAQV